MFETTEDPFRDFQKTNGRGHHTPLPLGNTNPQFTSVLPSTSPLDVKGDFGQVVVAGGIRDLPAGIYQSTVPNVDKFIRIRLGALAEPVKARDLELAGEVALFREIMSDWGLNDQQASAILGYKEPTFATDLFKGLTSIRQRDAEERLQLVITIAVDLEALYRDYDVIQKWLRKPHELLNGATPLAMATEGSSVDLLKVSEYVEYLSGR